MIRLKRLLNNVIAEQMADRINPNDYAAEIAQEFGETLQGTMGIGAHLGEGAYGNAYALQSGKVMKITADEAEVASAAHFRTRPKTRHIISYYDVREIQAGANRLAGYQPYWAIIMDRVRVLNPMERVIWEKMDHAYFHYNIETLKTQWLGTNLQHKLHGENANIPLDAAETFVRTMLDQHASVLKDMRRFAVKTYEAHAGNVGFDQFGQFVVFDVWSDRSDIKNYNASMRKVLKPIDLTRYIQHGTADASGIDTPNDPTM